jgi:5-dehydro-2-deoxygluconokinase
MSAWQQDIDLTCLGRAAVDLYSEERGSDLDEAVWFKRSLGGSAANTAVSAARQGLRVAMLTAIGADGFGRFVKRALHDEGIDVSAVRVAAEHLTGLVVLAMRAPEDAPHLFYRNDCADMTLGPDDIDADLVQRSRVLLLTGTHLSTASTFAASRRAAELARAAGGRVVLDVDYRPSLWGAASVARGEARAEPSDAAARAYREILPFCALVVGTEDEIRVAGGAADSFTAETRLLEAGVRRVVTKCGARGARSHDASGEVHALDGHPVRVVNAIGAGDAFLGVYVAAWVRGEDAPRCLGAANVAGALVAARPGCAPAMPTRAEIERSMTTAPVSSAAEAAIPDDEFHWRQTRPAAPERLLVLAQDHRSYFEAMFDAGGVDRAHIAHLKGLIFAGGRAAFAKTGLPEHETGFIVDAEYGAPLLDDERGRWRARPIEVHSDEPLAFAGGVDVALELLRWPGRQVVKCKVVYHPDAPLEMRARQEALLRQLQHACRGLDRTLLLEVVPMLDGVEDFGASVRALQALYAASIAPDWWKLPPPADEVTWAGLERVVLSRDPACSGILLLGNGLSTDELKRRMAWARASRVCRGFAFGRTVFADAARAWVRGEVDDADVVQRVRDRLVDLIDLWSTGAD